MGPVVAMYLARRGAEVDVIEHRPSHHRVPPMPGRSVNVVLSARGWRVLHELGLDERVRAISLPLRGRLVHALSGPSIVTPYGRKGEQIWSVERTDLNRHLLDAAADTDGVHVHHDLQLQAVEVDVPAIVVGGESGLRRLEYGRLFGCDGVFSRVRHALSEHGAQAQVETLAWGYKEIRIPPGPDGRWVLESEFFHIWPRSEALFCAFPNKSGDLTGSLFLPLHGAGLTFGSLKTGPAAEAFFASQFPDVAGAIPDIAQQYVGNPVNSIPTVRCDRWVWRDRVALVGDAAHAMAPFMGQGMNCGFEDARVLDLCLASNPSAGKALLDYEQQRKPNADAIADVSIAHFRNLATPWPTVRESPANAQVAGRLYDVLPDRFVPLYERCAFTEQPYADAVRDHALTEALLDDVISRHGACSLLGMSNEEFIGAVELSCAERSAPGSVRGLAG